MRKFLCLLLPVIFCLIPVTALSFPHKNILKIGSDVTIEKDQRIGSVLAIGGQITASGIVEQDITAIGGPVVLTKTAIVKGDVVSIGGVIVRARNAEVGGNLTEINLNNLYETLATALSDRWEGWSWIFAVISLSIFLVILMIALLIAALLPKPVCVASQAIQGKTLKVILSGVLSLILIVPLAFLLALSVIGIALIPLELIFVVCSGLFGFIAVGRFIGSKFLDLLKKNRSGRGPGNLLGAGHRLAGWLGSLCRLAGQNHGPCHRYGGHTGLPFRNPRVTIHATAEL